MLRIAHQERQGRCEIPATVGMSLYDVTRVKAVLTMHSMYIDIASLSWLSKWMSEGLSQTLGMAGPF